MGEGGQWAIDADGSLIGNDEDHVMMMMMFN
jgi:hypothetical protein